MQPTQQFQQSYAIGGDEHDNLSDLQFSSSVDTSQVQSVQISTAKNQREKSEREIQASSYEGVHVGNRQQPPINLPNNDNTSMTENILNSFSDTKIGGYLKESSHPIPLIFHLLFKVTALITYILGGWLAGSSNFVTITVICIILLALDFWVVKNVTGRLLVGLRWWNIVYEDGSSRWLFESSEVKKGNKLDTRIFWLVLYATPAIWGLLFFFGVIKFEWNWLIIDAVALTLSGANVYGYYRCSSEQKVKLKALLQQGSDNLVASAFKQGPGMIGRFTKFASSTGTQSQNQYDQSQGLASHFV